MQTLISTYGLTRGCGLDALHGRQPARWRVLDVSEHLPEKRPPPDLTL